jgi:DNA processing protein
MNEEKIFQLALSFVPGIGNVHNKQLISYIGSAKSVFNAKPAKLRTVPGVGTKTASIFGQINISELVDRAEKALLRAEKENVDVLHFTDKKYPDRLKRIIDAPSVLYYKGAANLNPGKTVSIVGTRQASEYGMEAVNMIIDGLVRHNAQIISGLAYGIDIYAHKSSLQHSLETIGVMATGINIIYPASHKSIAVQMTLKGGLITECPFDEKPEAHNFPSRNRIIAGMSDAVIIVEAAERGGALITAELANGYNKDVFAVPGDLNRHYSQGCNNLIKSHKAHILTSIKDLEYILNWKAGMEVDIIKEQIFSPEEFSEPELKVIETLSCAGREALIDDLSWKSQIPVNQLAGVLLSLEFKGVIKSLSGKKFKLL